MTEATAPEEVIISPGQVMYNALAGLPVAPQQHDLKALLKKYKQYGINTLQDEFLEKGIAFYAGYSTTVTTLLRHGTTEEMAGLGLLRHQRDLLNLIGQADEIIKASLRAPAVSKIQNTISGAVRKAMESEYQF